MNQKSVNMLYLGVFLCLVCAIAAGVMGSVAVVTKEPIAKAKMKKISDGLRAVLPPFNNNPMEDVRSCRESDGSVVDFYRAFQDGKPVGVVAEVSSPMGYGGRIDGLVSFTPDGKIRTVIVTGHNETPGLGTRLTDRKEEKTFSSLFGREKKKVGLPPNPYLDQFGSHSAGDGWATPWKIKKDGGDADYVSGATLSSRAVTDLAWRAASAFREHKAELLAPAIRKENVK